MTIYETIRNKTNNFAIYKFYYYIFLKLLLCIINLLCSSVDHDVANNT